MWGSTNRGKVINPANNNRDRSLTGRNLHPYYPQTPGNIHHNLIKKGSFTGLAAILSQTGTALSRCQCEFLLAHVHHSLTQPRQTGSDIIRPTNHDRLPVNQAAGINAVGIKPNGLSIQIAANQASRLGQSQRSGSIPQFDPTIEVDINAGLAFDHF